jgi:molecular chaperone GrpE
MGQVDEVPEPAPGPDGPIESARREGLSPSGADELELAVIEGLAEEDTAGLPPEDPGGARPTGIGAPAVPADSIPLLLDAVNGLGEQLTRRLDSLQTLFERELRAEASRERVIDRLHAELQEYKQDLMLKVQRPVFVDLIQLHDDLGKMIEARTPDGAEPERAVAVRGILESIRTAIEDILYRQGVEPFALEGDSFAPHKQRAVSTVPTGDPGRNKTIAARLRKGFQAGERLIRPEIVSVFTLRPTPASTPGQTGPGDAGESGPVAPRP